LKKIIYLILVIFALLTISSLIFTSCTPKLGKAPSEKKQEMYSNSPQFNDGKFHNKSKTKTAPHWGKMFGIFWDMTFNRNQTTPEKKFLVSEFSRLAWDSIPEDQLAVAWLGHSAILIKIEGKTILTDPVFSERLSPVSFMGPKHFDYSKRLNVADLPNIDAMIISHDHYDHLDYDVIREIDSRTKHFYVPLGVESHLEYWGIDSSKISKADWWDEFKFSDEIKLAFVPSQHFSGRGLTDRMCTLWGSWVIVGKNEKLFFSGDSGYHKDFKTIGEKYGPFDLAFMECGAYNKEWADVHMFPEESFQAALDTKSKLVMPIHWGKYDLAMHDWRDPVQRIKKAAEGKTTQVITPEINIIFMPKKEKPQKEWWKVF
jgi:L-ascorbate metabolism protein UlaG (beta-lactamase superfamily)